MTLYHCTLHVYFQSGQSLLNANEMKWNESGFRPPLCTYRLNWARRTSWGWWDDWDDTALQTQDSKFEPWRSEAEHATSRSRRLPTILTFTRGWGRNIFVSLKQPRPGTEPRTLAWKAAVLTTTLGPPPLLNAMVPVGCFWWEFPLTVRPPYPPPHTHKSQHKEMKNLVVPSFQVNDLPASDTWLSSIDHQMITITSYPTLRNPPPLPGHVHT